MKQKLFLEISFRQVEDKGVYICIATNEVEGQQVSASDTVDVLVRRK